VKRRLLNLLAGVSLAAAAVFAIATVSSLMVLVHVSIATPWMRIAARTAPLYLEIDELHGPVEGMAIARHGRLWPLVAVRPWGNLGFFQAMFSWRLALLPHATLSHDLFAVPTGRVHGSVIVTSTTIDIPLWMLSVASGLSAIAIWRARGKARRRTGCCPSCGYDLRATPERCPECGTVPRGAGAII
jgi:hypothetical protein